MLSALQGAVDGCRKYRAIDGFSEQLGAGKVRGDVVPRRLVSISRHEQYRDVARSADGDRRIDTVNF